MKQFISNSVLRERDLDLDQTVKGWLRTISPSRSGRGAVILWVLIYIFSYSLSPTATENKAEWRLFPNVVFQEFSSEKRCVEAKSKIEATLKHAGDKLRSGLNDLQKVGAGEPSQIIIAYNVECMPK